MPLRHISLGLNNFIPCTISVTVNDKIPPSSSYSVQLLHCAKYADKLCVHVNLVAIWIALNNFKSIVAYYNL